MHNRNSNDSLPVTNGTIQELPITPFFDPFASLIIEHVFGEALVILFGVLGIFTNIANICVYIKMGIKESTNISFFALSVFDLLVCMSTVVSQLLSLEGIAQTKMASGAPFSEISFASIFVSYPCLGCSAWVTAVLSLERYLCIAMPLKVKDILNPQRIGALLLIIVAYQFVFLVLFFVYPGPPYGIPNSRKALYFNFSFSAPTFISFFIVSISTILLIARLRRSLKWRNESTAQSSRETGNTRERKATRSVLAICIMFISCFSLSIGVFFASLLHPKFTHLDPYFASLFDVVYSFSLLLQILCSSTNILVHYAMSTKYRKVFQSLFSRQINKNF